MLRPAFLLLAAAVCLLPVLGYQLYAPGIGSGFFFDDYPNLSGLAHVSDLNSAIAFITEPKGGPLGRPVALASFLLNTPSWEVAPADFIHTNICLHLLNALLLMWCALRVQRLRGDTGLRAHWLALAVAALWMAQPLLVSTNLMIVQRMTTLALTFSLLGTLGYLKGLELLAARRVRAGYATLSASVVLGTVLAVFSKENGALLPLLLLVLQATLLQRTVAPLGAAYKKWTLVFLGLPALCILGYILKLLPNLAGAYSTRDFTWQERVLTEPRIVLRYLSLLLMPRRALIGPFQDDFPVSTGLLQPATTLAALLLIAGLIASALWLRRRAPVYAFAVLWFFAGHLLESTIIPLELYFEHRNYLPAIGPVVAIVALALRRSSTVGSAAGAGAQPAPARRGGLLGPALLVVYGALVATVCHAVAAVQGDKLTSAMVWHQEHPNSVRATENLALAYAMMGNYHAAGEAMARFADAHPQDLGVGMQALQLSCFTNQAGARIAQYKAHPERITTGRLNGIICDALDKTAKIIMQDACPGLSRADFYWLGNEILKNKNINTGREVGYCANDTLAMLYFDERDFAATMQHVEAAFSYRTYLPVAERLVEIPISAGRLDLARQNLELMRAKAPKNIFQAKIWNDSVAAHEKLINQLEKSPHAPASQP
ncbi:MAG: hypothetical protein ACOY5G_01730 [Pseudomonadota bacterium]